MIPDNIGELEKFEGVIVVCRRDQAADLSQYTKGMDCDFTKDWLKKDIVTSIKCDNNIPVMHQISDEIFNLVLNLQSADSDDSDDGDWCAPGEIELANCLI